MKNGFAGKLILSITFTIAVLTTWAQSPSDDWHLLPPSQTANGTGVQQVYERSDKAGKGETVIVAIIDSGVDIEHEDLKDKIWINADEIPGNNIDDDKNGYVDDVHGWNFIGGADGSNVNSETLEVTRLYAKFKTYFKDKDTNNLNRRDRKLYDKYLDYKKVVEEERQSLAESLSNLELNETMVLGILEAFSERYPDQELNEEFLESFDPGDDPELQAAKSIFEQSMNFNIELTTAEALKEEIAEGFKPAKEDIGNRLNYWYNPEFDSRKIVGDDYSNSKERFYGNNDVAGNRNFHGTHVAGIVGAVRNNDIGIDGIAENVQLMVLRTVPDGDERDKDVANAILYAVENGASVINMSFGKGQVWDKKVVDKAIKKARKQDVLLVHAAGNDASDNDVVENYPTPMLGKKGLYGKKRADNWIEVGAIGWEVNENAIAGFSNYGGTMVDLFAPGAQIYSTAPDDSYDYASGTSMAAPVVSGVAALIRSVYPSLSAKEVRDILVSSCTPVKEKVRQPGSGALVPMEELCISGGVLNAAKAFEMAASAAGKTRSGKSEAATRAAKA